ncbi:MAG: Na+/H+ antiporter NhaC family protein [Prevotella sp.]|nr:Na+/H+ antiporter NhaC family protein [Candidatus Prevotella equi]
MIALTPIFFFIIIYLVASIVAGDFYKVPISVAFMLTAIVAIATSKGEIKERINTFSKGAGESNIMLMIWIFILAGAFANSAKTLGSIDDVVYLTLSVVPPSAMFVGLFLAAALISLSVGTSVGTIVALTPIAAGIASATGNSLPMVTAIVVGGAFFGDNLSFISDTTVVATQTQGCRMSDKFLTNIKVALPAALLMVVLYIFLGNEVVIRDIYPEVNWLKIVPYLAVLVTAIMGMNVLFVLCIGSLLTGAIGLYLGTYDLYSWFGAMGDGILGMGELIIVTMLAGGILELIRANGGIQYLMDKILRRINSPRSAELSIAALVSFVDICTANNTVAIITVAGIAKDISQKFSLDPRRVASILDTFSCIMQGIIPYGAQLLMAAALSKQNPIDIIPYMYYPYTLAIFSIIAIMIQKRNKANEYVRN